MKNAIYLSFLILIGFTSCAQNNDKIIGIWDVKNDYYQATYEIVEHEGKFFGKVVKLLPAATTSTCDGCEGDKNGKSLLEIDIVENITLLVGSIG